MNKSDS